MTERISTRQEYLPGFDNLPVKRVILEDLYITRRQFSIEIENKRNQIYLNPEAFSNLVEEFDNRGVGYWENAIKVQFTKLEGSRALFIPIDMIKGKDGFYASAVLIDPAQYEKDYPDFSKREGTLLFINHSFLHEWWHLRECLNHRGYSGPIIYNEDKAEDFAKVRMKLIMGGRQDWQPLVLLDDTSLGVYFDD